MIKLLIVDDSALMRRQLASFFQGEPDFEIRHARNGKEAVEANRDFLPDVVTLDINMPEMDGMTALSLIMAERPVPVVMVSSLTEQGALATFEALNLGAVDYVAKPGGTISLSLSEVKVELVRKVRAAAKARVKGKGSMQRILLGARLREERETQKSKAIAATRTSVGVGDGLVLIGVSTGGPRTLEDILPLLAVSFPWPVVVAQHMPAAFTKPFADRLNEMCALSVSEATHAVALESGHIYIARGGADIFVTRRAGKAMLVARPENREYHWHPSVELMARSALEVYDASRLVAVMLTGMGYDGADGFAEIKTRGGRTVAESQESCVVFGMPAELIARGGATLVLPSTRIAAQLSTWVRP